MLRQMPCGRDDLKAAIFMIMTQCARKTTCDLTLSRNFNQRTNDNNTIRFFVKRDTYLVPKKEINLHLASKPSICTIYRKCCRKVRFYFDFCIALW